MSILTTSQNLAQHLERAKIKSEIFSLPDGFIGVRFNPPDQKLVLSLVQALGFAIIQEHEYKYSFGHHSGADLVIF